ncbi:cytochrome P450 [Plantactinospora sp. KLBMP9567]|uniref:cytochrome P450 family protein n=1 Tax=Plantactinospora sp. KLBMP9567 TaxID=3085900 RepID=UPI002982891F|nr:cytochrome P450 [Plantactinospora sp. KLBMP9567]MDW5329532.1 cytochrome P450 [Plantactinospora sp. KLBMP9567]
MRRQPFDALYMTEPYAEYARLHRAGAPIHAIRTPEGLPAWLVTGHREVRALLGDTRLSRNVNQPHHRSRVPVTGAMPLPRQFTTGTVATLDGPDHVRLRGFVNRALSAKRVRPLRGRVEQIVEGLLDDLAGSDGTDLMAALGMPLPITIICDMLGVPGDDRPRFRHLIDVIAGMAKDVGLDHGLRRTAGQEMLDYLGTLIGSRRRQPGADLISDWTRHRDASDPGLTDDEVVGLAFAFLLGGYDTTAGMIGASFLALLDDRHLFETLREHPELVPAAVEELLRCYAVLHTTRRFATTEIVLGDVRIAAGDLVLISIAAAGRDPSRFTDPDTLDFGRGAPHLAFGHGPHYCPGAELARLELTVTLEQTVRRLPRLALATPAGDVPWRSSYLIRVPSVLPVTY